MTTSIKACTTTYFDGGDMCAEGSSCEGYTLGGAYRVCEENSAFKLHVDMELTAPADFDLEQHRGFALGWGVQYEDEDKVGAYIAMYAKTNKNQASKWDWGTMSVTSPFSVAEVAANPKMAFSQAKNDRPLVWEAVSQDFSGRTFKVSAERDFDTQQELRDFQIGDERYATACFFTLDGKQGCTAPRMLSLNHTPVIVEPKPEIIIEVEPTTTVVEVTEIEVPRVPIDIEVVESEAVAKARLAAYMAK
jgi:hypothetical protein